MVRLAIIFILSLLLSSQAMATSLKSITGVKRKRLVKRINRIVQHHHQRSSFHGNIEVRLGQDVLYKNNLGFANESFDIMNTDKSRFMIASLSKQFTAAVVLKLVEEGLIDLEAPYSQYIKLKDGHAQTLKGWSDFTVKQLLNHTANLIRDVKNSKNYSVESYQPMVSSIVWSMTQNHNIFYSNPSDHGRYSNFGYLLLANLIEKVTNQKFHKVLSNLILNPLNMKSTGEYHRRLNIKSMAEGYHYSDERSILLKRCCRDTTSFIGSHSLYSDMSDLMIWLEDLISEKSKVLSKESIEQMMSPQAKRNSQESFYGFGFIVDDALGKKRVWHDGMEYGYLSLVSMIPEIGLKIIILGNRHGQSVNYGDYYTHHMNDEISELILKTFH